MYYVVCCFFSFQLVFPSPHPNFTPFNFPIILFTPDYLGGGQSSPFSFQSGKRTMQSSISKYRITKRVGGGSFGDIYLGVGANGEKVRRSWFRAVGYRSNGGGERESPMPWGGLHVSEDGRASHAPVFLSKMHSRKKLVTVRSHQLCSLNHGGFDGGSGGNFHA